MANRIFYYSTPKKTSDLNLLRKCFKDDFVNQKKIIHLHSCRAGPFLSNEIYLSLKEHQAHLSLKKIIAIVQPYGTVSRYLNYWLSGFEDSFCKQLVTNLELNSTKILHEDLLNKDIINDLAENYQVRWDNLVNSIFLPIYKKYLEEFKEKGFSDNNLEDLFAKYPSTETIPFDRAMVELSSFIVNSLLKKKNLPLITPYFPPINEIKQSNLKFINRKLWIDEYSKSLERRLKTKKVAINQVLKRLKSFNNKVISIDLISKILLSLKNKKMSQVSKFDFNPIVIKNFIDKKRPISEDIPISEQLFLSIKSFKMVLAHPIARSDGVKYLNGEEMLELCFRVAKNLNKLLILQSLMRGDSCKIYSRIVKKYQPIKLSISSCCTWDLKEFPEFDKNLIFSLDYL